MSWDRIYVSPHLDDVALSCGGQVHRYAHEGQRVLVVTVFAAVPSSEIPLSSLAQELHGVWRLEENVVDIRRREDEKACAVLGAQLEHWDHLDALYRHHEGRPLYPELRSLFTDIDASDEPLIDTLARELAELSAVAPLLVPLAAGGHVDHQIVRQACEALGRPLLYYEDHPYARRHRVLSKALAGRRRWQPETVELVEADLDAKVEAIACYESQWATAWKDLGAMERDVRRWADKRGGERLWQRRRL